MHDLRSIGEEPLLSDEALSCILENSGPRLAEALIFHIFSNFHIKLVEERFVADIAWGGMVFISRFARGVGWGVWRLWKAGKGKTVAIGMSCGCSSHCRCNACVGALLDSLLWWNRWRRRLIPLIKTCGRHSCGRIE